MIVFTHPTFCILNKLVLYVVVQLLFSQISEILCSYCAVTKTVSVELAKKDNIACILLHPGTVDTDLSRPFQRNVAKDKLFTREFSVQKLLSIIDNVKKSDNGKFFAWDGQEIPW